MCNNLKARYCLNIERDPIHRRYTALHHVTRSKGEPQVCRSDSGGRLNGVRSQEAVVATWHEAGIINLRFHRRVLPTLAHLVRRDDALQILR